uniref:Uncharacterized protein n=1 Tax=Tetraselmis chuii TaxID=63592 RepID=A0A7S1X1H7_9CHLO|mmetsp:Transcript_19261/g.34328  ORF Transcript_19261/g.34328 Transcript_19261/m.34328 type:complete len:337 (+) Transcript_19261:256-1266(+)
MLRFGVGLGGVAGAMGATAYLAGTAADIVLCRLEASVAAHGRGTTGVAVTSRPPSLANASVSASSPSWVWQGDAEEEDLSRVGTEAVLLGNLPSKPFASRRAKPGRGRPWLVAPARRRALLGTCNEHESIADDSDYGPEFISVRDLSGSSVPTARPGGVSSSPVQVGRHRRSSSSSSNLSSFSMPSHNRNPSCSEPTAVQWACEGTLGSSNNVRVSPDPTSMIDMVSRFLSNVLEAGDLNTLRDLCTENFRFSERNLDCGKVGVSFDGSGIQAFADCLFNAPPLPNRSLLESVSTEGHKVMVHFASENGTDNNGHLLIFHLDPTSSRIAQLVTCSA